MDLTLPIASADLWLCRPVHLSMAANQEQLAKIDVAAIRKVVVDMPAVAAIAEASFADSKHTADWRLQMDFHNHIDELADSLEQVTKPEAGLDTSKQPNSFASAANWP